LAELNLAIKEKINFIKFHFWWIMDFS